MPNLTRKLNDDEKHIIQAGVDSIYSDFLLRVAQGRHKSKADIDSIAQGRVWSGSKAIGIGLVDRLGNLDNAIACAQRLAKIKDYHVVNYPSIDYTWKEVIHQLSEDKKQTMLKEELGEFYNYYEQIQQIKKWKSIQARVPYKMEF
jgi:protease-4